MKSKKVFLIVLVVMLVTSIMLAGCSSSTNSQSDSNNGNSEENAKERIAVILMALNSDYWNMVASGAKKAGKDYNINVDVLGPSTETDVTGQVSMIEDQITSGVSAIVLAALQPSSVVLTLDEAKQSNIPVVLIDTDVRWPDKVSYVGTENYDGGKKAGEFLADKLDSGAKVAIIRGITGSPTHDDRSNGAIDYLKEHGIDVVTIQPANSERGLAMTVAENIIQAHPDLAAIYATNDEMALGALKAVEGAKKDIIVVGFDGQKDALASIEEGELSATVAQHPFDEGYSGVEAAIKAIKGEEVDSRIPTPIEVITKDNVAEFKEKIRKQMED